MKKSDYLQNKDKAENPYYYWIIEHEPEIKSSCTLSEEYLVFQQETGILEEHALSYIQDYLNKQKTNPDFVYCDEDLITEGKTADIRRNRTAPWLKPEWSPDTLDSLFYLGGLVVVRRSIAERISKSTGIVYVDRCGEDGICKIDSTYFEFLRACAKEAESIMHVPRILFHNRKAMSYEYTTGRYVGDVTGRVTVVILSKDNPDMLEQSIRAVEIGGEGLELEIIVVDNGSCESNRARVAALAEEHDVIYRYQPMEFCYSAMCNLGAKDATGDYLLFLNDDVELVGPIRFLSRMVWEAKKPHVGAVGIKLLYPNGDKIQHVGITDLAVGPSHKLATYSDSIDYDHGRNHMTYNYLAVTGACMMVETKKFREVSGFDERLAVSYTDVDLCVDLYEKGYYNLVINECFLYHHESVSRGNDVENSEKRKRLQQERTFFYRKHPFLKETGDPFYHKDLTKYKLSYEPDFRQEWELTEQLTIPQEKTDGTSKLTEKERFQCNIDDVRYVPAMTEAEASYVEIEGWVFFGKKDNLNYDISLLFLDEQSRHPTAECTVHRKYRKDLEDTFLGEKHILFSGFVCRIPEQEYRKYVGSVLAPALTKIAGIGSGTCLYKETTWQIGNRKD